jgi:hypothetical protein
LPGRKQLLELAKNFSLKRPNILIEEVQFALSKWEHFSKKSDVGKQSGQLIQKTISQLLKS